MKRLIISVLICIALVGCSKEEPREPEITQEEYDELNTKYEQALSESGSLLLKYETLNTRHQEMVDQTLTNEVSDASDDVFSDLVMQGIRVNYTF
ncbi:MAG TPA: hypothetical protein VJZ06_10215, partial [Mobilitalea sp.]|nr:hypothetical protein [Mobilitalea sp.]